MSAVKVKKPKQPNNGGVIAAHRHGWWHFMFLFQSIKDTCVPQTFWSGSRQHYNESLASSVRRCQSAHWAGTWGCKTARKHKRRIMCLLFSFQMSRYVELFLFQVTETVSKHLFSEKTLFYHEWHQWNVNSEYASTPWYQPLCYSHTARADDHYRRKGSKKGSNSL